MTDIHSIHQIHTDVIEIGPLACINGESVKTRNVLSCLATTMMVISSEFIDLMGIRVKIKTVMLFSILFILRIMSSSFLFNLYQRRVLRVIMLTVFEGHSSNLSISAIQNFDNELLFISLIKGISTRGKSSVGADQHQ